MNNFKNYILEMKKLAQIKKIKWDIEVDKNGVVLSEDRWNLNEIIGNNTRPFYYLSSFELVDKFRLNNIENVIISNNWIELIKAVTIEKILIDKIKPNSIMPIIFNLRVIASIATKHPYDMNPEDFFKVINNIEKIDSLKITAIKSIVKHIFDIKFLSKFCPIYPYLNIKKISSSTPLSNQIDKRDSADKLPENKYFWELVRILYTEEPKSFFDFIRFSQLKLLVLTGLRISEITSLPLNCIKKHNVLDKKIYEKNKQYGAVSHYFSLKYFAEKLEKENQHNILQIESQIIPEIFELEILSIVESIEKLTLGIRSTLKNFENKNLGFYDDYIPAYSAYLILSGNSIFLENIEYDTKELNIIQRQELSNKLIELQIKLLDTKEFTHSFYTYMQRLRLKCCIYNQKKQPYLSHEKIIYRTSFFRKSDILNYIFNEKESKSPDLYSIKVNDGSVINSSDFLFLYPKRALIENRNNGLLAIDHYLSIGVTNRQALNCFISKISESTPTIFEIYGSDEFKTASLKSHSFRHLMNTELFRKGIADSLITKHFNRQSISQTYEYDHRSLAEKLDFNNISTINKDIDNSRTEVLINLINENKTRGPLISKYLEIQEEYGDDEAYLFLKTEADGFHTTPYGHCVNSFAVDPCPKHLECFSGCNHFMSTGLSKHKQNLINLRDKFKQELQIIEGFPSKGIGKLHQIDHIKKQILNIELILESDEGSLVFPAENDLSDIDKKDIFDA